MNPYYIAIAERANHRCKYCKAPEVVFNFPFEVEHIIPLSREGANDEANLALACRSCNLRKGNRINGVLSGSESEVRFFHPREDQFELAGYWANSFILRASATSFSVMPPAS